MSNLISRPLNDRLAEKMSCDTVILRARLHCGGLLNIQIDELNHNIMWNVLYI
jgi:hypothetical protein